MKKRPITLQCLVFTFFILASCNNKSGASSASGYTSSSNGLQYKLIKTGGSPKASNGQYVEYAATIRTMNGEKISYSGVSGKYLLGCIIPPRHKADPLEVLTMMGPGDSASVIVPEQEFFSNFALPANVKDGDNIMLDIALHKVYTKEQYETEVLPTMKQPAGAGDRKRIEDFIASKGWKAERTASGLYVVVDKPGTGKELQNGKMISMNYDGTLLDGSKFDSNVDNAFNHVQPFQFTLGQGQVIKGWDEGIPHFKVGGKGKLIIPANLGYGDQAQAKIPAGSVLVFEVEVLGMQDAPPPQQPMQIQAH